jgi:ATP-dependent exoDNAse (exonuclease V) alpha subunit
MYLLDRNQQVAYDSMISFLSDTQPVLLLQGQAGTGKTFIVNDFVQYLKQKNYPFILCAPTHKAKLVLETFTKSEAITLHSLLSLSPNVEIFNLDYRQLKFKTNGKINIPVGGIVIVDESSMITDDLYKLLTELCKELNTKILFVGDSAQIQGVSERHISKVFQCKNKITLTILHRQNSNNGLIPVFEKLRKHSLSAFSSISSDEGSLFVYRDIKEFMLKCTDFFKIAKNKEDISYVKLIAYTNARVQGFNDCIRRLLWRDNDEYHQYEFLTGYENFNYKKNSQFYNSLDYIIVEPPKYVSRSIPEYGKVPGYLLELYDTVYKGILEVFIIVKDFDDYDSLACQLEDVRFSALECKSKQRKNFYWRRYFEMYNSFATPFDMMWDNRVIKKKTLDYGYSSTVHKIQGSSLDTIFIDMDNIMKCKNEEELRQMQYVALSRTRKDAYLYF